MGTRRNAGFSVVEVLIATGIFLIIAVGLLPLFITAIRNNVSGRDATDVSNMGKSRLEEYFQLPFNNPSLDVPAGETEFFVTDTYSFKDRTWTTDAPQSGDYALWERTTRVRLFGIDRDNPDPVLREGGSNPDYIHLKEIRVEVASTRSLGNPFGGRRELTLQMLKAK